MEATLEKLLENIATIRRNKGLSQEYVASQIGLEQPSYSLIEKGSRSLVRAPAGSLFFILKYLHLLV